MPRVKYKRGLTRGENLREGDMFRWGDAVLKVVQMGPCETVPKPDADRYVEPWCVVMVRAKGWRESHAGTCALIPKKKIIPIYTKVAT
jgi:hypothetical protein